MATLSSEDVEFVSELVDKGIADLARERYSRDRRTIAFAKPMCGGRRLSREGRELSAKTRQTLYRL